MVVMEQNIEKQMETNVRNIMGTDANKRTNKCSAASNNLRKHAKKSYKCNQCDFASSYASALRTHLKKHSGEKPNKCNQCDFARCSLPTIFV